MCEDTQADLNVFVPLALLKLYVCIGIRKILYTN